MRLETMGHGDFMIADLALGKKIMEVLEKHYADHAWFCDVSHEAGTATVQLMYEGRDRIARVWKYGFLMHINKLSNELTEGFEVKIRNAGGEVLERYRIARRRAKENDIVDFMGRDGTIDDSAMVH